MSASADEAAVYGQAARPGEATFQRPRCDHCRKLIAYYVTQPFSIKCGRCGHVTVRPDSAKS